MGRRGRPRTFDRDLALRKALVVFWEQGYEATTISQLTQAMGIRSASLYACYGAKEALFREALAMYGDTVAAGPRAALSAHPTAREAIVALLHEHVAAITRPNEPAGCLLVLGAPTGGEDSAPIRALLAGIREQSRDDVLDRLKRAVRDGEFAATPRQLEALARFYATVLHGLSIQARDGASREELDRVVSCATDAWATLVSR